MTVLGMYSEFREKFPSVTEKVDLQHIDYWGSLDSEQCYCWFESLAKTINSDMAKGEDPNTYTEIFEFLRSAYLKENDSVKNCIDVSFTENLFWEISVEKAEPFWLVFPDLLKGLYVAFHNRTPAA